MDSSVSSTDSLLKLVAWLDKNKQKVALMTGAALIVGGLIALIIYHESQKEVRASQALSDVRKSSNASAPDPAGLADAYLKIVHDFDGTKAAGRALLEAAAVYFGEANYAKAEATYKQFLNGYPESPFQPEGMLGLASTLDAEGKSTEAIAKYEEIKRRFPTDSVSDETKLGLARLYEKSNPSEAYKLYTELSSAGSQSGIGSEAGIRLADLVEKHPELAKPPTPPPAPPTTVVVPATNVVTQGLTNKTASTNRMIMSVTNIQNKPGPTVTIPAPTPVAGTSASAPAPMLLKPNIPTNKP